MTQIQQYWCALIDEVTEGDKLNNYIPEIPTKKKDKAQREEWRRWFKGLANRAVEEPELRRLDQLSFELLR